MSSSPWSQSLSASVGCQRRGAITTPKTHRERRQGSLTAQVPELSVWIATADAHRAQRAVGPRPGWSLCLDAGAPNRGPPRFRLNSTMFTALPLFAAWRFVDAVTGFEIVYAQPNLLRGHTSAVENGQAYAVRYEIALDAAGALVRPA